MGKYADYSETLLKTLYKSKNENTDIKEVKSYIDTELKRDFTGMSEIITDLNNSGYTNILVKNGIGKNFFLKIGADYLTLKGMEHIETNILQK